MAEKEIQQRQEKILNWFKKPTNALLSLVLAFALIIRSYYFIKLRAQPLWWDELCYGSLAKNFVNPVYKTAEIIIGETNIRPPFFPYIWSILLKLGFNEIGVRFILEFIPSVLAVFFIYLIGKELYNKKVGIASALIFSSLWIHLFYTVRLLTNIPALVFLFPSVYYFIKSQKTKQNKNFNAKYFGISIFLLSISTLFRYPNGLVFFAYLFFMIFTWRTDLLKKPSFYISGIIGIIPILIFFLINFMTYGNIFPALLGGGYIESAEKLANPINPGLLRFIPAFLQTTFLILFLIGIGIALFELLIGFDMIKKKPQLKSHLILILILVIIYSYFIFFMRVAEDRWLFATALPLSCLAGFGSIFLYNKIKKYNKIIAAIIILLILAFGAYNQVIFADQLIKSKQTSYLQMRQGFEWIKQNTPEEAKVIGSGIGPYAIYYSERYPLRLEEEIPLEQVKPIEADYMVLHAFTPQANYINDYITQNKKTWQVTNAFFFDQEQTQPAVVIYQNLK